MKNIERRLYLVPLLLILIIGLDGCNRNLEELSMTGIKNVAIREMSTKGAMFEVTVGIKNPNNMRFRVRDADLDLVLNNSNVGNVKLKDKLVIPAMSEKDHTFVVEAEFGKTAMGMILGLISAASSNNMELGLKGELKVGKFLFTKKVPVDLKEKISLKDLQ